MIFHFGVFPFWHSNFASTFQWKTLSIMGWLWKFWHLVLSFRNCLGSAYWTLTSYLIKYTNPSMWCECMGVSRHRTNDTLIISRVQVNLFLLHSPGGASGWNSLRNKVTDMIKLVMMYIWNVEGKFPVIQIFITLYNSL